MPIQKIHIAEINSKYYLLGGGKLASNNAGPVLDLSSAHFARSQCIGEFSLSDRRRDNFMVFGDAIRQLFELHIALVHHSLYSNHPSTSILALRNQCKRPE